MHSEEWHFDDHDNRSEISGISYATSIYSEVTDSTVNSQPEGKKTKRFKKINPVHLAQLDEQNNLNKVRGSVRRAASEILPLDQQDTLHLFGTNAPPEGPSLFAKESFGPEKLQKKLSLGGELARQISQSKIRESLEMDPNHISMVCSYTIHIDNTLYGIELHLTRCKAVEIKIFTVSLSHCIGVLSLNSASFRATTCESENHLQRESAWPLYWHHVVSLSMYRL